MIRLFPKVDQDDLIIKLFHKAVDNQWSSEDLDWDAPLGLTERQVIALTNIITPVYLGEQSAMNGAANVLPDLISRGETAAQLYLSTFLLDEARHFEALTRLYNHVGQAPLALRRMPEMLRYHHRLSQGDRVDWLWGILISDLFAREFYLLFSKVQPNALFGRMSLRILRDESRHQAFAHAYLKAALPGLSAARRAALVDMKDELLGIMQAMNHRLQEDADVLGIDGGAFMTDLIRNIEAHAGAIGLGGPGGGAPGGGGSGGGPGPWQRTLEQMRQESLSGGGVRWPVRERPASAEATLPAMGLAECRALVGPLGRRERRVFPAAHAPSPAGSCDGCVVALFCRSRLMRAVTAASA